MKLIASSPAQGWLCLRLTSSGFENRTQRDKARKRYGFDAILQVECDIDSTDKSKTIHKYSFNVRSTGTDIKDILESIHDLGITSNRRTPKHNGLSELARFRASTLFELILLQAGCRLLSIGEYTIAEYLFRTLEASLAPHMSHTSRPRSTIRRLHATSLIAPSEYRNNEVPIENELEAVSELASKAVSLYGDQFPRVLNIEARNRYYLGDLDGAIELASKAEKISSTQGDLTELIVSRFNLAVLHLLCSNWSNSQKYFELICNTDISSIFNIDDLIDFADSAQQMGYPPAIYLQFLYRRLAYMAITAEMKHELERWLNGDNSRRGLKKFLNSPKYFGFKANKAKGRKKQHRNSL